MKRASFNHSLLGLFAATILPAAAIQDSNSNGLSDVWERYYNGGNLFSGANPSHAPTGDPDHDGWDNQTEAIAGTDPFSSEFPEGWVRTEIHTHPESEGLFLFSWSSIEGKVYRLCVSTDLVTWSDCDELIPGTGDFVNLALDCEYETGGTPERMFWRIKIDDEDPDGDTLSSWEELALGTNHHHPDTDLDGIFDNEDSLPGTTGSPIELTSATYGDPDGVGLPSTLNNNLVGRWDFENYTTSGPTQSFPDISGNNNPFENTVSSMAFDTNGIISRGVEFDAGSDFLKASPSLISGRSKYTISFWFKFKENYVRTKPGAINTVLFSYNNNLDAYPDINLTVYKATALDGNQLITFSHYKNGVIQPEWYLNIPKEKWLDDGQWRHLAFTSNSGTVKIYLDGELLGTLATAASSWTATSTGYFTLGKAVPSPFDSGNTFRGSFDRMRVYSRDLSAGEVESIHQQDADRDGIWDITEVKTSIWRDLNSNGERDTGEYSFSASPFRWQFPGTDSDGDGLIDTQEQLIGTHIGNADSDGDLLPDGWEVDHGLNPLHSNVENGVYTNSDSDSLNDLEEFRWATDPTKFDTDDDGVNDDVEIGQLSNPNDDSDQGQPGDAADYLPVKLGVGDESGSESEDYILNCFRIDPLTGEENRVYTLRSGGQGQYDEKTISNVFRRNETYTFQIEWQSSKFTSQPASGGQSAEGPDYDYSMIVEPQGSHSGYLIDSWKPGEDIDTNNPILGEERSDVANNQTEFVNQISSRRVALVNLKVDWLTQAGSSLELHKDPWTEQTNGVRWFPGAANPGDADYHDIVSVRVTGGLPNSSFWMRSFDVDDTTSSDWDTDEGYVAAAIDKNGDIGRDNTTHGEGVAGISILGRFLGDGSEVFGRYHGTLDSTGTAAVDFRVGYSPGNNYRIAATIKDEEELDDLHVGDVPERGEEKIVSAISDESPDFKGGGQPSLDNLETTLA